MYLLQCLNLAFCLAACCSANTLQLVPCWSARLLQKNGCALSFLAQQRAQQEITIVIQTNDIHCHDHCLWILNTAGTAGNHFSDSNQWHSMFEEKWSVLICFADQTSAMQLQMTTDAAGPLSCHVCRNSPEDPAMWSLSLTTLPDLPVVFIQSCNHTC